MPASEHDPDQRNEREVTKKLKGVSRGEIQRAFGGRPSPRKKRTHPEPRQYNLVDLERARDRVEAAYRRIENDRTNNPSGARAGLEQASRTYARRGTLNDDGTRSREKPPHRDVLRQARLRLPHNHMHRRGVTANMLSTSITHDRARRRQLGVVGLALAKLWIW